MAYGRIGLGLVALAAGECAESMVPGPLWARECAPAQAGHRGTGSKALDRLVAAGDPWRGPTRRCRGRLVPEGDGTLCQTPSSGHGGSGVTRRHRPTAVVAIGPVHNAEAANDA